MKLYQVIHFYGDPYDEDEETGLASQSIQIVETFTDRKDAEEFINQFQFCHEFSTDHYIHVYGIKCGSLSIREVSCVSHEEFDISKWDRQNFWWLNHIKVVNLTDVRRKIVYYVESDSNFLRAIPMYNKNDHYLLINGKKWPDEYPEIKDSDYYPISNFADQNRTVYMTTGWIMNGA